MLRNSEVIEPGRTASQRRSAPSRFAMHVDDALSPRAHEIVDVLRHKRQVVAAFGERAFEPGQREVRRVGRGAQEVRRRRS